ncbi:MAG: DNA replication and repair protein RecF [Proteobacteria bacterium]|nr:DNA replication and repair protein RecF [Pseudomonadota bacterium]
MFVSWLELRDFRSYATLRFDPEPGINVLIGDNGEGKTSVLEAVGYLGMMKSFRSVPDGALVKDGTDAAVVRSGIGGGATEMTVEVELPLEGRRTVLVNGKRPKRMRDLLLSVPVVAFLPDDLDVIKRGPGMRRDYLDDLSSRLWPQAGADLTEYERALRQRNTLLKQSGRGTDQITLDVWDTKLSDAGARVLMHRRAVATALQDELVDAYRVVGGSGDLRWAYRSTWKSEDARSLDELGTALQNALIERRHKDMDVRTTTVGPHRDEPELLLDGRATRTRASQGEQRTAALALRIGAYRVIREVRNQTPILLLDDVFSELDIARAKRVLSLMPAGQVFVTTAREDEVSIGGRRWSVSDGKVA